LPAIGESEGFAELFCRLAAAQGDEATAAADGDAVVISQHGWRLMDGAAGDDTVFAIWNALWEGCLAAHDRRLRWTALAPAVGGARHWRVGRTVP
jgi:hypothetical protein